MAQSRQKFAFARCGASVALAATLSLSMVPATALAEVGSDAQGGGAVATAAADTVQTPDGFYVEKGKAYSLTTTFAAASGSGTGTGMVQGVFGNSVTASYDGEKWNVTLTASGQMASMVSWVKVGGIQQNAVDAGDGTYTFTFSVNKLSDVASGSVYITAMSSIYPDGVEVTIAISTDGLSTTAPEPEPGDQVSTDALEKAIANAESLLAQSDKSEEANEALQAAISEAKKALDVDDQDVVDAAVTALENAVSEFEASESVPQPQTLPVSYFVKDSGSAFSGMLPSEVQAVESEDGGYDVSIPVPASTINMVGGTFWVKDASGAAINPDKAEDGTWTYVLHASSVDGAIEFSMGYTVSMDDRELSKTHNMIMRFFDCTAINNALAAAKDVKDDGSEAYKAVANALAAAQAVVKNPAATKADLDAVAATLNSAIEAFNNQGGEEQTGEVQTSDGFKLVVGQVYTLPVGYVKVENGQVTNTESVAAGFMEDTVDVVYQGNGTYSIILSPNEIGKAYLTSVEGEGYAVVKNADGSYTVSGIASIAKDIVLSVEMPGGKADMGVRIDTSSLPTVSNKPVTPPAIEEGNNNNNNTITNTGNEVTEKFQVGHTYQVPIAFLKHNSSETSMAAQYLGDTALVRPQENGTFQVSFAATSEGLGYIKSLSYNGSAIAQSGNQFTLSIPAAESDVVIPIEMAITMMEQLGIGQAQTADMHLYLSQAKDLGTGQASLAASSSNLAQTGDSTTGAATLAVGVAVAGAAAAVAARRRLSQQK